MMHIIQIYVKNDYL